MASKQGYNTEPKNYLDRRIRISLNGNRIVEGRLRGFDPFLNLVLDDCVEKVKMEDSSNISDVRIGTVIIRGNSIVLWECLDKIPLNA